MRVVPFVIVLTVAAAAVWAEPSPADKAIERGLTFLARDAVAWKKEHKCASCHHAALIVWSMREAKQRGFTVDEPVMNDLTRMMAESGDGRTGLKRPTEAPEALNTKAVMFALALGANPEPDTISRKDMTTMLATVKSDQTDDGSWSAWPDTRPPIFGGSDEVATLLATLALLPAVENDAAAKAARDKAVAWLEATETDNDPQSIALRLVLWKRLNRPQEKWMPLAKHICQNQNDDGGWSQADDMASDAWATGQALYALATAGVKADAPTVVKGHAFLVKAQRDDGSWPMKSRPSKVGGPGGGNEVPITGAGSAWAVLGLVRSR